MKSLKFAPSLVKLILDGSKRTTWRLFDDKDLQIGDELSLVDASDGRAFAQARIVNVVQKSIRELTNADLAENSYADREQVLTVNRKYYGETVSEDTIVKIIKFELSSAR